MSYDNGGEVNAYLSTVMGKGNFSNVGDLTIGVQATAILRNTHKSLKERSELIDDPFLFLLAVAAAKT